MKRTTLQGWTSLKEETENISKKHMEFSEQLLRDVEEPISNFLKDQKKPRTAVSFFFLSSYSSSFYFYFSINYYYYYYYYHHFLFYYYYYYYYLLLLFNYYLIIIYIYLFVYSDLTINWNILNNFILQFLKNYETCIIIIIIIIII